MDELRELLKHEMIESLSILSNLSHFIPLLEFLECSFKMSRGLQQLITAVLGVVSLGGSEMALDVCFLASYLRVQRQFHPAGKVS